MATIPEKSDSDRFIRLPTPLLEALFRRRLTGTQLRIVLWVIRHTLGWNRQTARFSWYAMAKELAMDRGGVVRMGNCLIRARLLHLRAGQLGIQDNISQWDYRLLRSNCDDAGPRWITGAGAEQDHRKGMTGMSESDAPSHRFSVERKTGVKTVRQRRRGGGFVDKGAAGNSDPVRELVDTYIALSGIPTENVANFHCRFRKSAEALLAAYGQNLEAAKGAILRAVQSRIDR